uniref:Syndecan domain-containing protein n=1 Tax=Strongyloides stercoralis TaxID=6248 RepID=A0A0K0ET13_STRER
MVLNTDQIEPDQTEPDYPLNNKIYNGVGGLENIPFTGDMIFNTNTTDINNDNEGYAYLPIVDEYERKKNQEPFEDSIANKSKKIVKNQNKIKEYKKYDLSTTFLFGCIIGGILIIIVLYLVFKPGNKKPSSLKKKRSNKEVEKSENKDDSTLTTVSVKTKD